MLRLTTCSLLVGLLVAVSALPLEETANELLEPTPTTTSKTITLQDVMNDETIKILAGLLTNCDYVKQTKKVHRVRMENALREEMAKKQWSDKFDSVLIAVSLQRNLVCPQDMSFWEKSTEKPSDNNEVESTEQSIKADGQETSDNFEQGLEEATTTKTITSDNYFVSAACGPNSYYYAKTCLCNDDSTMMNGKCAQVIGKLCINPGDCSENGDVGCYEGICQWKQDYEGRMYNMKKNQ